MKDKRGAALSDDALSPFEQVEHTIVLALVNRWSAIERMEPKQRVIAAKLVQLAVLGGDDALYRVRDECHRAGLARAWYRSFWQLMK